MKLEDNLSINKLDVSYEGVVDLYEWCRSHLDRPCNDAVIAVAIVANEILLSQEYDKIVSQMWIPMREPKWNDWKRAEQGCVEKWADRDNNGNILVDREGNPVIEENKIEFENELKELKESDEFKDFIKAYDEGMRRNEEIKRTPVRVNVCCIDGDDHCPTDVNARLLGILFGKTLYQIIQNGR
jgi:hypothetical protein